MIKKLILTAVLVFAIMGIPMTCKAIGEEVTITAADGTSSGATISGTTDASAVMVQIRNADGDIVSMASFPVVNNEFSCNISQSLTAGSEYTIYVADYEGGTFATQTVTASESTTNTNTNTNTSTNSSASSDAGSSSAPDSSSAGVTPAVPVVPTVPEGTTVPGQGIQPAVPSNQEKPAAQEKPEAEEVTETTEKPEKPAVTETKEEDYEVAELSEEPGEEDDDIVIGKPADEPKEQEQEGSGKGFLLPLVIIIIVVIGGIGAFLIIKKIRDDNSY